MACVKNARIYRHGDVALIPVALAGQIENQHRIKAVEKDKDGRHILAFGESSGHYHAVEGGSIVEASGGLVLEVPSEGATIKHLGYDGALEHEDVQLPGGKYVPVQQHEFDMEQGWSAALD